MGGWVKSSESKCNKRAKGEKLAVGTNPSTTVT
jgi:hypothetical protein